jgi:NAD+ synthase (glutamine-hydrolysing)
MRLAIAQLNPTVGDFDGNVRKVTEALEGVADDGPSLVVFPEMFLAGYPPRDLLERDWFVDRAEEALESVVALSRRHPGPGILIGTVTRATRESGRGLHNSAVLIRDGSVLSTTHKTLLPNYDVFDEERYFDAAPGGSTVPLDGLSLGISICEDAWTDPELWKRPVYDGDPVADQAEAGAGLLVNISASPFCVGKDAIRHRIFSGHARRHGVPFVVVNQVGGNDELIFDGRSMCVAPDGKLVAYLPAFKEDVRVVDTASTGEAGFVPDDPVASVHDALILGLSDYVAKCGFERVAVGLSGGIDSAVVCALAAEALGPDRVTGVTMPSAFSSPGSVGDSVALAENLGVKVETVDISATYDSYVGMLESLFACEEVDVTLENVQARIRGNVLMALSNREGSLVLSTGNKSELAVGYCTLYGDMSGGLAVISDVPKTMVYGLARHINRGSEIIPRAIIDKPPSAELRPGQLDQDTLPGYDVLDAILAMWVDEGLSVEAIVARGHDRDTVMWVARAVDGNEYKRRQAAPGLKVTSKAFGTGRRMPIAARYRT